MAWNSEFHCCCWLPLRLELTSLPLLATCYMLLALRSAISMLEYASRTGVVFIYCTSQHPTADAHFSQYFEFTIRARSIYMYSRAVAMEPARTNAAIVGIATAIPEKEGTKQSIMNVTLKKIKNSDQKASACAQYSTSNGAHGIRIPRSDWISHE